MIVVAFPGAMRLGAVRFPSCFGPVLLAAAALLSPASLFALEESEDPARVYPVPVAPGEPEIDPKDTFLEPNAKDRDGTAAYVHVTEADMPLLVAVGFPKLPPRFGSREDGREAAIEAMRMWERAIQPHLSWFRLEFVKEDDDAPVQVVWKRRIAGAAAGRGGLRYWVGVRGAGIEPGRLRVGGTMEISTSPGGNTGMESRLRLEELPLLVAHEFGHVLGLGHCLDCDAAMNYSWETLGRVIVTDEDVRTFRALVAIPNGMRVDGRLIDALLRDAPLEGRKDAAP